MKAKKVVLATGSEAQACCRAGAGRPHPDQHRDLLSLNAIPKSLVVIGSGAVGVEFASIFKSFGAEVTMIEMLQRIVPVEDEDVSKELLRHSRSAASMS